MIWINIKEFFKNKINIILVGGCLLLGVLTLLFMSLFIRESNDNNNFFSKAYTQLVNKISTHSNDITDKNMPLKNTYIYYDINETHSRNMGKFSAKLLVSLLDTKVNFSGTTGEIKMTTPVDSKGYSKLDWAFQLPPTQNFIRGSITITYYAFIYNGHFLDDRLIFGV